MRVPRRLSSKNIDFAAHAAVGRENAAGLTPPQPRGRDPAVSLKTNIHTQDSRLSFSLPFFLILTSVSTGNSQWLRS